MGKSKPPAPPDPKETSAASTATNVGTAISNAMLGNVNQVTPDGNLNYDQTGTYNWRDPYTGKSYDIPTFTATQTLSPAQQAIKQQTDQAQQNLAGLAASQSGFLQNYMSEPIDLSNDATEARLMELGRSRLDPLLEQRRESEATRLANQGIMLGSTAYDRAMNNVNNAENDAYNQLLLQGRGQAVQEALTQRNQPINEIIGLMSGSQVQQPNFVNANMPTIPTTDVAGLINTNYNQRLSAWEQQQAQAGGLISGVGGLFGSLIGLSDDDAKKDKKRLGDVEGEMGLWEFRYKGEPKTKPKHVGLMASEVQKQKPSAVKRGKDGLRRVDYGKALGLMEAR
jgi:hypothetical protein